MKTKKLNKNHVYGLWFMDYGLWFMVYGLWFMVYRLWVKAIYLMNTLGTLEWWISRLSI